MPAIQSLSDLQRLKEQALQKRAGETGKAHIMVGMGSCGIALGADQTLQAILDEIESQELMGIGVTQTGCIGLCEYEPIVQVRQEQGPLFTYGHVTPEIARRILAEHIAGGKAIEEYLVKA